MTGSNRQRGLCVCCGREGLINGRGLISTCYSRARLGRRLHLFPLIRARRRDDLLDRWERLARHPPEGLRAAEAARMLGMTEEALQRALCRARRAGDKRAIYLPHPLTGIRYRQGGR